MPTVNTVRGPIAPESLGVTLMHEHIFVLSTEIMQNYPESWGNEEKRVAEAVARLNELGSHGIQSVVDLTVVGFVLMAAGAIGLVVALVFANQRSHTSHVSVQERRNIDE